VSEAPIVVLAALMGVVTYLTRVVPFLVPLGRLPGSLLRSVRLMGPATLASVAAVSVALPALEPATHPAALASIWLGTAVCVVMVTLRRGLALGIMGALATGVLATAALAP